MKYILLISTLIIGFSVYAQNIDYSKKTHEVTLEDEHLFNLERECDNGQNCRFYVSDLSGKEVVLTI